MYSIELDKSATKAMLQLPLAVRERIFSKLEEAKAYHHFARLVGRPDFRMRVGGYRVFALVDVSRETIFVTVMKHRKNAYDQNLR